MADKTHWENIYLTKRSREVSWYQEHAELSIRFIQKAGVGPSAQIIDVGGGSSTLVDDLLAAGFENVTVLDISGAALRWAQDRLGALASTVKWVEADITQADLQPNFYDVWHDRAAFHFLTRADDRHRYVQAVKRSVKTGGNVIVASFGPEGPERCSGLEVVRYSPETMHDEFGDGFELVDSTTQIHHTPSGTHQQFIYCCFRRRRTVV
jgi:ubiquinone/menaquinone biosynthesis C-methylase UbiE